VQVAASRSAAFGNSAALDPECRIRLCSGRNVQLLFFPIKCRHRNLSAKRGLRKCDGNVAVQIVLAPLEEFVFLDIQDDVEIARGTAFSAGVAFAGNAQLGSIVDAGRDLQFKDFLPDQTAFAAARKTPVFDDLSSAVALMAGAGDAEETLLQ